MKNQLDDIRRYSCGLWLELMLRVNFAYLSLLIVRMKKEVLTCLLQMLVWIDTSTRIARVYDNHGNSILISKSFNTFNVNLPTLFGNEIKITDFKIVRWGMSIIGWEAWSWKQNVGTRASKDHQCYFNCLDAANCEKNVIWR